MICNKKEIIIRKIVCRIGRELIDKVEGKTKLRAG